MLYASINAVYTLVKDVANVNQRGFISPSNLNAFAAQAQIDVFHSILHEYKLAISDRQRYLTNYKGAYNSIQSIEDDLRPLLRVEESLSYVSGSSFSLPSAYAYILGLSYLGTEVTVVRPENIQFSRNSYLSAPTTRNPTAYFTRTTAVLSPSSITSGVKIAYYKMPQGTTPSTGEPTTLSPSFGYNEINGAAVYNPSTSVNFELPKQLENKLATRILSYAGISLRESEVAQFAEMQQQKEIANG
jgi:hypothetical protein